MAHQILQRVSADELMRERVLAREIFELDRISELGASKSEGEQIGKMEEMARSVGALMENMNWTLEQAMDALNVSEADRENCKMRLAQGEEYSKRHIKYCKERM